MYFASLCFRIPKDRALYNTLILVLEVVLEWIYVGVITSTQSIFTSKLKKIALVRHDVLFVKYLFCRGDSLILYY